MAVVKHTAQRVGVSRRAARGGVEPGRPAAAERHRIAHGAGFGIQHRDGRFEDIIQDPAKAGFLLKL